jgi:Flp pilus assembly protein TadG
MNRCNKRRGASAVEFALVAPIFFAFVLGIIEIGRGFMVINQVNNAARFGARAGVISGTSRATITSVTKATLTNQGISCESDQIVQFVGVKIVAGDSGTVTVQPAAVQEGNAIFTARSIVPAGTTTSLKTTFTIAKMTQ